MFPARRRETSPPVVFMFPGQSSQYQNMGAGLCKEDAKFRADIDTCAEILKPHLQVDLREPLFLDSYEAESE